MVMVVCCNKQKGGLGEERGERISGASHKRVALLLLRSAMPSSSSFSSSSSRLLLRSTMALLLRLCARAGLSSSFGLRSIASSPRCLADLPEDPKESKTGLGVTGRIPTEAEQATGVERQELLELLKGKDNPFGLEEMVDGHLGTLTNPRLVPSHSDSRLVGCNCDPESEQIFYIDVKKGSPCPCPCGKQYFQLVEAESPVSAAY
eukprot:m.28148 g.28148  ORF g.28148 m.28148 type:complete len:205 (-) comp14086_c0_seq1:40-654(-)